MKQILTSQECHDAAESARRTLNTGKVLPSDVREQLVVVQERGEVLAKVEAVTGMRFNVDLNAPGNVGGYARPDTWGLYMSSRFLSKRKESEAVHISRHEANHKKTQITKLDVEKKFSDLDPRYLKVLKRTLKKDKIEDKFLMEGFNEYLTKHENGDALHSGYDEEEVPAARELEKLSLLYTRQSLLSAFERGDTELFFKRLKVLCEMLIVADRVNGVIEEIKWN